MNESLIRDENYVRAVIDALPSAVFVVNNEFKIFDLNPAAKKLFGIEPDITLRRFCGAIMHCLHALNSDEGCGTTEYCPDCVIRNSVETVFTGKSTLQKKYRMKIQKGSDISDIHMLVTATSFLYGNDLFALLCLEDITEVVTLQRLLPICSSCSKIRNDDNYWESVADYLKKHTDLEFTHGICTECARKLYPDSDF